jgi:hypothetical protein
MRQEIERRAQSSLASGGRARRTTPMIPLALGSLGIAIPLMAIAGGIAGLCRHHRRLHRDRVRQRALDGSALVA